MSDSAAASSVTRGVRITAFVLLAAAACLVPWIIWLHYNQIPTGIATHLKALWVGLDTMEFAGLALSGVGLLRHWTLAPLIASFTAALLFLDAWFNVVATKDDAFVEAVVMAIVVDLPMTVLLLWAAVRLQRQLPNPVLAPSATR